MFVFQGTAVFLVQKIILRGSVSLFVFGAKCLCSGHPSQWLLDFDLEFVVFFVFVFIFIFALAFAFGLGENVWYITVQRRIIYNFSETPWFCFLFFFEWILSILLRDPWRQVGGSRRSAMAGSGNIPTTQTRSPGYWSPYFAILMITAGYRTWTRSLPHWLTSSYWVD